jgi:Flp pilus assembly protein TadG
VRAVLRPVRNDRGGILAFVAVGLVVILGMIGLALDSAHAYVVRAHLTRAVDGATLAAARELRSGERTAEDHARAIAQANGVVAGIGGTSLSLQFGTTSDGEQAVFTTATRPVATNFLRLFGVAEVNVTASAIAAVPPVDLVLVLDQSGSLGRENCGSSWSQTAWDCLQSASKRFVDHFDEDFDQMGLVTFQLRGTERFELAGAFAGPIKSAIDKAKSDGDTNPGEGLRRAARQMSGSAVRERSAKAVVFFTDGRATAFRGNINERDRMMAVYTTAASGQMRGYFNNPDELPADKAASADGCRNSRNCWSWTESRIRREATDKGTAEAEALRAQGIHVYAIGLGNPSADPILAPDMDWLALIANENGLADPDQPQGRAFFAQSGADLTDVFDLVAKDLLVRLMQ